MSGVPALEAAAKQAAGIGLVERGVSVRAAALQVGIDKGTLSRACQRVGLVLPKGRRPASRKAP